MRTKTTAACEGTLQLAEKPFTSRRGVARTATIGHELFGGNHKRGGREIEREKALGHIQNSRDLEITTPISLVFLQIEMCFFFKLLFFFEKGTKVLSKRRLLVCWFLKYRSMPRRESRSLTSRPCKHFQLHPKQPLVSDQTVNVQLSHCDAWNFGKSDLDRNVPSLWHHSSSRS